MDVERSSLCNCVVNFLLEENYLLTAFELLHELLDDGRDSHAIRLKEFFSDPAHFPPDQISRFNSLRVADPQSLLEEKEALEEKFAICDYELRLAQEDIAKLKLELKRKTELSLNESYSSSSDIIKQGSELQQKKSDTAISDLGHLKDNERRDLNCAVKEYLLLAGYRLTTMTFYEEVTDQNLDVWQGTPACVPDALRRYYYQYLSSSTEAAEEKIKMLRENEDLRKVKERLILEKDSLVRNKDLADGQIAAFTKSMEATQRDLRDRENQVQVLKQLLEQQRWELNECRAEITSLKMHIEGSHSGKNILAGDTDSFHSQALEKYKDEIKSLQLEIESLKAKEVVAVHSLDPNDSLREQAVIEIHVDKGMQAQPVEVSSEVGELNDAHSIVPQSTGSDSSKDQEDSQPVLMINSNYNGTTSDGNGGLKQNGEMPAINNGSLSKSDELKEESVTNKMGSETIQILADALPRIVPFVLINHREELLPLIMCAIERHPDSRTRDSLTFTLFNLIKRPDEQQRQIIMDACVSLAKNVGEMRTETELLPQCWEQINHMYEERRLLVAQSCGQLAEYVRPEIRDSLILSIIQQLVEDSATIIREAAAHNLALLLRLFPNQDKYFKVEELMFQLSCDPSGAVVETTLKELVPAIIKWGNKLDHVLRVLLSHMLGSSQRCPPLSGVEGSIESHLRVLGERERWNIDVLLRMLLVMLPFLLEKTVETCPFSAVPEPKGALFSSSMLQKLAEGQVEWPAFEWLHVDCFPDLIKLLCLLPQKEDNLRNRTTKFLLAASEQFGEAYLTHIMLPIFMVAVGDDADLTYLSSSSHSKIKGLRPRTAVAERLAIMCVLPTMLAGVLGAPSKREQLTEYLRRLLVKGAITENQAKHEAEIFYAIRFLCSFDEHHTMIFNILWEMVVSSNTEMKVNAANLLKVIVPYIDARVTSTHVLPALVTLGSDQNLNVKYASIEAFGSVAQHFKNDMIVDKIRVQMDAFLDDGSHEATIAVVRALGVAVPHSTEKLREYILHTLTNSLCTSLDISTIDVDI
ncbi:hypothetical protein SAY87_007472 [Trapa incisa]|uniref:HEAT repeat-containing protein n=1 Tax=Trapa incisa TaxID=236973 RepID=A0AAN7QIA2_9MYRT|nr:hypothetical protein SAY87_007472 [Trapa incisa]